MQKQVAELTVTNNTQALQDTCHLWHESAWSQAAEILKMWDSDTQDQS